MPNFLKYLSFFFFLALQEPLNAQEQIPEKREESQCMKVESRQFDFWIGLWDVVDEKGKFVGINKIQSVEAGCVLQEEWTSAAGGYSGRSLNWYGADAKWHQKWIDSNGDQLNLDGGLVNGAMVLTGETPSKDPLLPPTKHRITWSVLSAELVRQLWESSNDAGITYETAFDGRYRKLTTPTAIGNNFFNEIAGQWIGSDKSSKESTHGFLSVKPIVAGRYFALDRTIIDAGVPRIQIEEHALYQYESPTSLKALMLDSLSDKYEITATGEANTITAYIGDTRMMVMHLVSPSELEVIDKVNQHDGKWSELRRLVYKRVKKMAAGK
ncbi:MAG: hypothetical protein ABI644_00980 [Arenimonas sp.]